MLDKSTSPLRQRGRTSSIGGIRSTNQRQRQAKADPGGAHTAVQSPKRAQAR